MKKKSELLKEVVLMMSAPKIQKWYNENLETNPQAETIDSYDLEPIRRLRNEGRELLGKTIGFC